MKLEPSAGTVAGLAGVGLAVCCGLPALLSFGAGITIAGLGLGSWAVAGAGLGVLVLGFVRHRRLRARGAEPRLPIAPGDARGEVPVGVERPDDGQRARPAE